MRVADSEACKRTGRSSEDAEDIGQMEVGICGACAERRVRWISLSGRFGGEERTDEGVFRAGRAWHLLYASAVV